MKSMYNVSQWVNTWCVAACTQSIQVCNMMTSPKFSALLPLCEGNPPATGGFPSQMPVTRSFDVSLICDWTNGWANNPVAGDLRRHFAHYDVTVMMWPAWCRNCQNHGWWCPGSLRQDISSNCLDCAGRTYSCLPRGMIEFSFLCHQEITENRYMFLSFLRELLRKIVNMRTHHSSLATLLVNYFN